jgi:hypothetical protein
MQGCTSSGRQRRPDRRRLRARRFFCHSSGAVSRWRGLRGNRWLFSGGNRSRSLNRSRFFLLGNFRLGHRHGRGVLGLRGRPFLAVDSPANQLRYRFVYGTRVGFLFGDAELWQHFEKRVRGDLELPGELVDANFTHTYSNTLATGRLSDLLRVLYGIKFSFRFR